mgnify:CR=1 FL=1|tara:strand:- start:22599 stop:22994 length:396 start_codon:yes stop_codon:yes gene_type:complete
MEKKIKSWQTFNEAIDTSKFSDEDWATINRTKEANKDNNTVVFNVENGQIDDNKIVYIEDPMDSLVNHKGQNREVSTLALYANFPGNDCELCYARVPKQISSHLTPGFNNLDENSDSEIIHFLLNNKLSLA